jgi:3-hydroxyisobutyrate dehydrogenase
MSLTVAFIGLGSQGAPIAKHLAPAGFPTRVFDLVAERMDEAVASGATAASSAAEAADGADVIEICVPEDDHVRVVVAEVLPTAKPGAVIAIHSTVLPDAVLEVAVAAAQRDIDVLDACVTGGPARAVTKDIAFLVGGTEDVLERARPVLAATSRQIIHAGELGNGARLKLCINLLTYIQWAAAYESFQLARAVGLPVEIFEEAGTSNGQLTDLQQQFLVMHKLPDELRLSDEAQRNLRGFQAIAEKDLRWALRLADQADLDLPVGELVSRLMGRIYGVEEG